MLSERQIDEIRNGLSSLLGVIQIVQCDEQLAPEDRDPEQLKKILQDGVADGKRAMDVLNKYQTAPIDN